MLLKVYRKLRNISKFLFPILGVVLIISPSSFIKILPYVLGITMICVGLIWEIEAIHKGEYKTLSTMESATALVMLIIGIGLLIKRGDSLALLGTTWGFMGLVKGTRLLNYVIYSFGKKNMCWQELIQSIATITLAIILLFNPFDKFSTHVRDRKSTRMNSSHIQNARMPSSA